MERQTKHRILAIFVVIGLVIILLPLFQSDKDITNGSTTIEAPPFPDQVEQIDDDNNDQAAVENVDNFKNPPKVEYQNNTSQKPVKNNQGVVTVHTDDYRSPSGDDPAAETDGDTTQHAPKPDIADQVMMLDESKEEKAQRGQQLFRNGSHKTIQSGKPKVSLSQNKPTVKKAIYQLKEKDSKKDAKDIDDLFKLQNPVWVIQVGSFKHKPNAQKLVNRLRGKGYPAFMQQASKRTRVYVGPRKAKKSARELAVEIHADLKIKGIVVSYKPFKI